MTYKNQYCYLCHNKKVVTTKYGDFCYEHLTNMFNYIKRDLSYKVKIMNEIVKDCLVCSKTKLCFKHTNQVCSEFFMCETCLSENNELVKGVIRYDSLVMCEKHHEEFKPSIQKLYSIFELEGVKQ